jgi:predicted RNase H-like HicB family nuclease
LGKEPRNPNAGHSGRHENARAELTGAAGSVSFPDFPGAITTALTLDEAVKKAGEALALHVEVLFKIGEAIPEPSSLLNVTKLEPRTAVLALIPLELPEASP